MADKPTKVAFTVKQIEYLNRLFPEVTSVTTMTEAALRHSIGQRSIVKHISSLRAVEQGD